MSGFTTIIGFMFSFFVIILVFFGIFYGYQTQINNQVMMLEAFENKYIEDYGFNIDFSYPFYDSNKLSLELNNLGNVNLQFNQNDVNCFDVYVNGIYIAKDEFDVFYSNPQDNYYVLMPKQVGVLEVVFDVNLSERNVVKIISCSGSLKEFIIDSGDINWNNEDYIRRTNFNVVNAGGADDQQQYYNIELNDSNFDFSKATEDSILFFLPTSENLVLGLDFNEYLQTLDDYSRYDNVVRLGPGSGVDVGDPSELESGASFSGLSFDGVDDYLNIISNTILQPQKEITMSAWVFVDNWGGDSSYPILDLGGSSLFIDNSGGANNQKLGLTTSVGSLYSNVILNNDSWHYVVGTYNGSLMKVYIDAQEVGNFTVSGDMVYGANYYVGRDISNNYFSGNIDEIEVLNIVLNDSEIVDLYKDRYLGQELNYTVTSWDVTNKIADLDVRLPVVARNGENVSFELYYYYAQGDTGSQSEVVGTDFSPAQITDLLASSGNTEVDLTWSEPNDNGYAITSYTVEYGTVSSGLFDNIYVDDSTPGATITGLTNDIDYQFRVFASSSQGAGVVSDTVASIPTGSWWMISDVSTNLGVDGSANQGTSPIALAQMNNALSTDASSCIGIRTAMVNYVIAQEYTSIYSTDLDIIANIDAQISVDGSSTSTTWRASLYEYNDAIGDVRYLGVASGLSSTTGPDVVNLVFDNVAFTVASGNRLKVVLDATNGGNKFTYLCYGVGTQSYFAFDKN